MSDPGQLPYGQPTPPPYQQPPYGYQQAPPNQKDVVTSLVLGILSLVMCGLFTGIPAMVLGRRARREIAASHGRLGGDGLAMAGFVTGLIGTVISGLTLLFVIAVFAFGGVVSHSIEENCQTVQHSNGTSTTTC